MRPRSQESTFQAPGRLGTCVVSLKLTGAVEHIPTGGKISPSQTRQAKKKKVSDLWDLLAPGTVIGQWNTADGASLIIGNAKRDLSQYQKQVDDDHHSHEWP